MTSGRVIVVATSPHTPPGLLSWPAWEALRAGPVLVRDAGHPALPHLAGAGVLVREVPGDDATVARQLHGRAAAGERPVWLSAGGADQGLVRALGSLSIAEPQVELEIVYGSYDTPGSRLLDVVAVMDRLRSPGGCPWDAEQTHDSLLPYLLEEAYEACEAIEDGDRAGLREELGDVLLQVAFHARIAAEDADDPWSIDDVAGDLVDKLVRRHPHVFAGGSVDDLDGTWEALKAAEKRRSSVTDGIPLGQPALSLAAKLQKRATRLGAPVPSYDGLGGELWELVARCREQGLDAEAELRAVGRSYRDRLAEVERRLVAAGHDPAKLTAEQWQAAWSRPS